MDDETQMLLEQWGFRDYISRFWVVQVLNNSVDGQALLLSGRQSGGKLNDHQRRLLGRLVIGHILDKKPNGRLSSTEYTQLKADVIQEERLKILHNNIEPWSLIQHNWQITTELRFKKLAKVEGPLINYFNEFPALKQPEGYQLLCEDFSVKFPGKEEILTSSLILKRDQIIHIAREKLNNTRDNDLKESILRYLDSITDDKPDSKSEVALLLLPYILPILPSRKKGNHIHWKPSRSEIRDGFITHVSSSAEVKPTIEQRQIKLSRLGRTFQPIIILTPSSLLKHMRTNRVVCARGTTEYKRGESNCLRHFSSAKAFQRHLLNAHGQLFQPEIARDAENSSQCVCVPVRIYACVRAYAYAIHKYGDTYKWHKSCTRPASGHWPTYLPIDVCSSAERRNCSNSADYGGCIQ
ncbi:hypothetical protein EVAR_16511_1 [Eumeta japonica]|uniref:Uncharacterized protein n=1 Tax=Eumeta variegata TaxID=151549 RepID=A0A4C1U2Y5_EUMVA|nr:hypothetical protein EVAR_16511_1 [Eumeta japonica]